MDFIVSFRISRLVWWLVNDICASAFISSTLYNDILSDEPWIRFMVGKVAGEIHILGMRLVFRVHAAGDMFAGRRDEDY